MIRANLAFWSLLVLGLSGCSGTMERMSTWMGVEQNILIEQLGQPHRSYEGQFGLVQSYYRNRQEKFGCTDDFTLKDGVIIGFASDCGIFGGWLTPTYEP